MDFDNRIIRESARQRLRRTADQLATEPGRLALSKDVKRFVQRSPSRAALARHFGVISVTPDTPAYFNILRELYALTSDPFKADSPDHRDLVEDPASFFVMSYW